MLRVVYPFVVPTKVVVVDVDGRDSFVVEVAICPVDEDVVEEVEDELVVVPGVDEGYKVLDGWVVG